MSPQHWTCHLVAGPSAQLDSQRGRIVFLDLDAGTLDLSHLRWTCHFEAGSARAKLILARPRPRPRPRLRPRPRPRPRARPHECGVPSALCPRPRPRLRARPHECGVSSALCPRPRPAAPAPEPAPIELVVVGPIIFTFLVPWSNHPNNNKIIVVLVPSLTRQPESELLVKSVKSSFILAKKLILFRNLVVRALDLSFWSWACRPGIHRVSGLGCSGIGLAKAPASKC